MCEYYTRISNKTILLLFLIFAILTFLPFLIADLAIAYGTRDDYCLSYAGMSDTGIVNLTLRDWLKVDAYTRLFFVVAAVFFYIATRFLSNHYALVVVESTMLRIFLIFMFVWTIVGS